REASDPDHGHDHGHPDHGHDATATQSFVVRGAGNATRAGVQRFFGALPDSVWRAKGFIRIDGAQSLLQYSLGQLEVTPAGGAVPSEALVFIGSAMDRAAIEAAFAQVGRP